MKNKALKNGLLAVLLVLFAGIMVGGILLLLSDAWLLAVSEFLTGLSFAVRICGILIFAFLLLLLLVWCMIPVKKRMDADLALRSETDGNVTITADALEKMAELSLRGISGLKDARVHVHTHAGPLTYDVKITVLQNAVIPALVEKIRTRIKDGISERIGKTVETVNVSVVGTVRDETQTAVVPRVK